MFDFNILGEKTNSNLSTLNLMSCCLFSMSMLKTFDCFVSISVSFFADLIPHKGKKGKMTQHENRKVIQDSLGV